MNLGGRVASRLTVGDLNELMVETEKTWLAIQPKRRSQQKKVKLKADLQSNTIMFMLKQLGTATREHFGREFSDVTEHVAPTVVVTNAEVIKHYESLRLYATKAIRRKHL